MTAHFPHWPNLVTMFLDQAARLGGRPFLGAKADGEWVTISWAQAATQAAKLAEALTALGVEPGDRVAIISENRPEWAIADLGVMAAGAVSVPTYTTNTTRDHLHILENSGARAAIVSTARLAQALLPAALQSGVCRDVIHIAPVRARGQTEGVAMHAWDALLGAQPGDVQGLRQRMARVGRSDLACVIYTSGTGGAPRGVRFHHGMILHNVEGAGAVVLEDFPRGTERFLSFLPLSHSYEHSAGLYLPIALGAEIWYAEGIDKLAANIEEARPTIMIVVPRLFEVMRQRMIRAIEKKGGLAPRMLDQALRLETRREAGGLSLLDRAAALIVERTIRRTARQRFGGRLKAMVSGGAPLNPEVGRFFSALGLLVLQGYGQTESGPIMSCNRPAAGVRMHTVGPPLLNTEVRIAPDGEILCRGELVMHGYWMNAPETTNALKDGWLHTGDIGHLDADGHIVITDRKKDIIVNDKGDNVAPQRVQGMLTLQPEIVQAMVYGDRRPYLVGVVVPDPEWATGWAEAHGLTTDPVALRNNPEFVRALQAAVDRVNADLSVIEKVRRIIVADAPFSVENEQLTPSMKIRRHVLAKVYGPRLDALYG
jgi:long-chain acyl-CoA synthetase